jgi:hypothetical protein
MKMKVAAMSAALAAWQPAPAATTPETHEVAVALIDVGASSLRSDDPNVRFVDMSPPLRDGDQRATKKVAGHDHGDIVAQAFVDEYRRMDPDARITFYTVNPFVQRGMTGQTMFSMSSVQQALPKIREAGARIAVTTFGVADEAAGARILKSFTDNGMIVFAATPNDREDKGIWPAANPATISVADGVTGDSGFLKTPAWGKWVDFVSNGIYHSGNIDTDGSSFATPRVAAYGAFVQKHRPDIGVDEMKAELRAGARQVQIHGRSFPRLDGQDVAQRFVAREAGSDRSVAQTPAGTAQGVSGMALAMRAATGGMAR